MSITVMADNGKNEVYLNAVADAKNASDAAHLLWASVHQAARIHGGRALIKTPDTCHLGGYVVMWESGPKQWADAYAVCDGACGKTFAVEAMGGGNMVRFSDLH